VKDFDKFRTPSSCSRHLFIGHVVVFLSSGISLLCCSWYIIFEMADYSFASEIKFVPTLYLSTSPAEYYDWKDAMEDFLWDRGLKSRMKVFFAGHTFSASALQWWIKLQQRLINRGKDPYRTWKGMKAMLQRRFDPPIEERVHKTTSVAATISSTHFLPTKSAMKSSWSDSIIGDVCLTLSKQQAIVIKHAVKKVAASATSLHGPQRYVLPLSSKSNDNMDTIESDISIGNKLN
jgi:hypothetical protein